ncbi:gamma carbonic anhydrase family protein [Sphingomonas sp. ID1715]|uniref:gamma carbonic anhydrase family protein n=1 Tax=Sphingomonas sp. ID1715 TaxID=1656898 RepID=UPI0014877841|nr:gamma carbonic anhydrase family protein [Sphingomonas sp. ID1715]NNM75781.1 gamma carbonic anhydrase family protein [Sphingomonas sp. ID1715]
MDGVSLIEIHGKRPRIHDSAFIAPGCRLIGDIEIGPDVSIWYNCVLRADVNFMKIGARTNIQDGSVCHVDSPRPGAPEGHPLIIGEDVLIGHLAMVHGCVLADRAFVGLGAIVMDGCAVDSDGMLAAGAMLTPGKRIGARELWGGRPAKMMRMLGDAEIAGNQIGVAHYVENGRAHRAAISG